MEAPATVYVLDNLHTIDINQGQLGVTVRLGSKWADRLLSAGVRITDHEGRTVTLNETVTLDLQETLDGVSTVIGKGTPTHLWYGAFRDIPARFIEFEHEESSRLYTGLLESMRRAYGTDFSEDDEVTVFSYIRTE